MPLEIPYKELQGEALQAFTWRRGLLAVVVLVAAIGAARLAGRLVRRGLSKKAAGGPGMLFAGSKLLTYFLVAVGVVATLGVLGVPFSSLMLTSSLLLVGAGFSLQHVARDFIASIVLLVEQRIRKDDFITFGQTTGTVQEVGLRATQLLTPDGTVLVVPNHVLMTTEVSNHSHPVTRARLHVELPVSLLEDVDVVTETLQRVARSHPRVLLEPPPMVRLQAIRESYFQFALIVWIEDAPLTLRIASELRFAIARSFARHGLEFPTPELRVRLGPHSSKRSPDGEDRATPPSSSDPL